MNFDDNPEFFKSYSTIMVYIGLTALLMFIQLFIKKDKIKEFVFKMEKEWRRDEDLSPKLTSIKRKMVKQTDRYIRISCLSISIVCSIYLLNPLLMVLVNKFILHRNVSNTVALGLATPFNYEDNFLSYILLVIVEYRLAMIVAYELQCSQYFITISMDHLRVLFILIQEEFKEVIFLSDDVNKEKRFKETIQRHTKLLELLWDLNGTFGCLFAINYIFLSSTICFCVISACTDGSLEDLKTLCISILVIVNVFYCCRGGEYLINTASEVSTAIYDTPWYELPNKYRKDLIFIMLRSQRVAYVTSTSYIKISLKTFIRIMNMTWSFISLITTVYDTK
ncbi:odorant receptor 85b-like [Pieris rapae]|uniref:odorant receptor 85b-like n=1 Tax=Pieris rapae TaxID=64459 RepID=UPI001E28125E|nr:odorant receptor 85b-like [Pieris rapae]